MLPTLAVICMKIASSLLRGQPTSDRITLRPSLAKDMLSRPSLLLKWCVLNLKHVTAGVLTAIAASNKSLAITTLTSEAFGGAIRSIRLAMRWKMFVAVLNWLLHRKFNV